MTVVYSLVLGLAFASLAACSKTPYDPRLPDSSELGSARGHRIARVITHAHSPISYDACDKEGSDGKVLNADCLGHLRDALCKNRVDYTFLTDHPDNLARFEMGEALIPGAGDELVNGPHGPYVNRGVACEGDFRPRITVGFESRLLAMGMTQHLAATPELRLDLYDDETVALRNQLVTDADAIVAIPHTESRDLALIRSLDPHAIEIYNIHANLDPKIRKKDLGLPPFQNLPGIMTFLIDPYGELNPDFMFMNFLYVHPMYFQKWNTLVGEGRKIAGIGGSDTHENVFKQKGSDGERLDSHRRLLRFMSNHAWTTSLDPDDIKDAIRAGRSWLVFEGFGSPVGLDLHATVGATVAEMGETVALAGGSAAIHASAPTLHAASPRAGPSPEFRLELRKASADGTDTVVASSTGGAIDYVTNAPGAYRLEIHITPRHLRKFLTEFEDFADREFRWVVGNHVFIDP